MGSSLCNLSSIGELYLNQQIHLLKKRAKDLATLAHPQYQQTKKLDQEDVAAKISAGIDTLGAIN